MKVAAIADTHTTLWYLFADARLSKPARTAIEQAATDGQYIGVSAISLAEVVYLTEKGRIAADALRRLLAVCHDSAKVLVEVPVDSTIIQRMPAIPRAEVPDLPDRIIAATALALHVPVITRDNRIQLGPLETIW